MRGKAEPRGATPAKDNLGAVARRKLCATRSTGWKRSSAAANRRLKQAVH